MIKECDPPTLEEYNKRARRNQDFAGMDDNVTVHFPCPGCCSKGWCVFRLAAMPTMKESKPTKCKVCERTFFLRVSQVLISTEVTLCQSDGDDVPDYLDKIIRV